jgi:excisionase family DNA binding protein
MKPKIIEQRTIDTILGATPGAANVQTTANDGAGQRAPVQRKHELRNATIYADESQVPRLPDADISTLLNLLADVIVSLQREAPPASPPEVQALRQVTIRQAAAILGVHERTIRRLVQRGELHVVGRGRLSRIALRDIADYQKHNRR